MWKVLPAFFAAGLVLLFSAFSNRLVATIASRPTIQELGRVLELKYRLRTTFDVGVAIPN
jgi:hypothetical protein